MGISAIETDVKTKPIGQSATVHTHVRRISSSEHRETTIILSPFLFNYTLEYAIRKVQENQERLKPKRIHQLLILTNCDNLMGEK